MVPGSVASRRRADDSTGHSTRAMAANGPSGRAGWHSCADMHLSDALAMDKIVELQADTLRALASPRRLEILYVLERGPREVGSLALELGITQPNVSQHLGVLRSSGLVEAERDGREVRYRISDPDVTTACAIMRGVLERRLAHLAGLTERLEAAGPSRTTPGHA
jgi:ArsR family transcriptional regulator